MGQEQEADVTNSREITIGGLFSTTGCLVSGGDAYVHDLLHNENSWILGVDIEDMDAVGGTPLSHASRRDNVDIIALLLEYGAERTPPRLDQRP